jgi:hypothetical protein
MLLSSRRVWRSSAGAWFLSDAQADCWSRARVVRVAVAVAMTAVCTLGQGSCQGVTGAT